MKSEAHFFVSTLLALVVAAPFGFGQPIATVVTAAPNSPVAPGQSVTMTVSVAGSPASYQWMLNGANIPGATNASCVLPFAGSGDRGVYQVVVTRADGAATVDVGSIAVMPSDARLMNLSGRSLVGTGNNAMIVGFVCQAGPSSTDKNILVRGMGPALAGMGGMSTGLLSNPILTLYDGHSFPIGSNMGWTNAFARATGSGASRVQTNMQRATQSMMRAVGAFTTTMAAADSAVIMNGPPGAYTAMMSGANNASGIGLVECYDADAAVGNAGNSARLINMSARATVGTGANVFIGGFALAGGPSGTPGTILLRAMGPALTALGVSGAIPAPTMTLYDGNSRPIASNSGWSNGPIMATGADASTTRFGMIPASMNVMARVGAFPPTAGSGDCAMVATLPPGAYTLVISGLPDSAGNPTTGLVLCELYEVP